MNVYQSKYEKTSGTSYSEVERTARRLYNERVRQTKRNPYLRSRYFDKDKIFLSLFWTHLNQKPRRDRKRRLRYYACALDLLEHTLLAPDIRRNPNGKHERVFRFAGVTKGGNKFYVQVKESTNRAKYFISVFGSQ